MNYQKSQEGYSISYTKESFEEVLQQAYDALEADDIKSLLCQSLDFIKLGYEDNKVRNITLSVIDKRNISFKQWKAISAYVSGCKRKEQTKNNKTF